MNIVGSDRVRLLGGGGGPAVESVCLQESRLPRGVLALIRRSGLLSD